MLTLSLTRHQLYELYHEGVRPTIGLIEDLIEQLADFEHVLGVRQQQGIDSLRAANERKAVKPLEGATAFYRIRSYLSTARKQRHLTLVAL